MNHDKPQCHRIDLARADEAHPALSGWHSHHEIGWCSGCANHAVLVQVQRVLSRLGVAREKIVFISGIGCSSRFPYYINTYGLHGIHGRAPAIALGLKCARPELSVWIITGDGDGLSIGANHLIHCLRRNLDVKILLFNNQVFGLTKGQYSPTSQFGMKTKSSPQGTIEQPIQPIELAIAAGGTFVARSVALDTSHLGRMIEAAANHKGTAFVEIQQNCLAFNRSALSEFEDRTMRDEHWVFLEHGKPIRFGKTGEKGLVLSGVSPKIAVIGKDGVREEDVLVHDCHSPEPLSAYLMAGLRPPEFPMALGIFREVQKPSYDGLLAERIENAVAEYGPATLPDLLAGRGVTN